MPQPAGLDRGSRVAGANGPKCERPLIQPQHDDHRNRDRAEGGQQGERHGGAGDEVSIGSSRAAPPVANSEIYSGAAELVWHRLDYLAPSMPPM